jgi:transglutaminase-like putative cysteine protease
MSAIPRTLLAAVCLLPASALAQTNKPTPPPIRYTNPVTYDITQRIAVTNEDVSHINDLELNLPIPEDSPSQTVTDVRIEGNTPFILIDSNGLARIARSLYPPNPLPTPGKTVSLAISCRVTCYEIHTSAKALRKIKWPASGGKLKKPRGRFLSAEQNIETKDPAITALAKKFREKAAGPYDFARAAYNHVIDHTEYGKPEVFLSAKACLEKRQGDCGCFAGLFVGICRAGGVEARPVVGRWAEGKDQWHCWAEFRVPGARWIPADLTAGKLNPASRDFYFGNLDNNRVILASTFNCSVESDRGSRDLGFIQVGTWWWHPAADSAGSNMKVDMTCEGTRRDK